MNPSIWNAPEPMTVSSAILFHCSTVLGAGEHFGEAHRDCEISGATPPPAPWPSTSAKRAGLAGCSYARAGPPAVSTWDVSERVRVWTVAAGLAAVEPVDRRDVGGLELEVENLDVLADPLGRHRLREDDVPVLDVPAKDDLRYRFADAAGDPGQRWV